MYWYESLVLSKYCSSHCCLSHSYLRFFVLYSWLVCFPFIHHHIHTYIHTYICIQSNYAPIKRLTLERKSPVTRLDINAPDFTAYKKSYPGLYKTTTQVASAQTTKAAAAAPVAAPVAATAEPMAPPATDAAKPDEPPAAEE